MGRKQNFPPELWNRAKAEMRGVLVRCARKRRMITYATLAQLVRTIRFRQRDFAFHEMLGEISEQEDAVRPVRRGMLSAVVVYKYEEMRPGEGFFRLAKKLGRDTSDRDKCWLDELRRVWRYWATHKQ